MALRLVTEGEDVPQIWRVAAKILNKNSRLADWALSSTLKVVQNYGEEVFSDKKLGIIFYTILLMITGYSSKICHSKISNCQKYNVLTSQYSQIHLDFS
jgi:hypothetical protein